MHHMWTELRCILELKGKEAYSKAKRLKGGIWWSVRQVCFRLYAVERMHSSSDRLVYLRKRWPIRDGTCFTTFLQAGRKLGNKKSTATCADIFNDNGFLIDTQPTIHYYCSNFFTDKSNCVDFFLGEDESLAIKFHVSYSPNAEAKLSWDIQKNDNCLFSSLYLAHH